MDAYDVGRAYPSETFFLNEPQKFYLKIERKFSYLVQKKSPSVRHLGKPRLFINGPGKRHSCVPEKFAFNKAFRNRAAVDRDKGLLLPRAFIVDCPRDKFFPCSAFARYKDVCLRRGNAHDKPVHLRHLPAGADNVGKAVPGLYIFFKKDIKSRYGFSNIVGASRKMAEVYGFIMSIAAAKANVLITGESGTGKELVARAIHNESPRKEKPFVTVNCGAIPESLVESELFGHARGAFTGAVYEKAGLAEMADGGTLFLDEITELPLNLQVKLLRFIQEKSFRRVGSTNDISVDMRLIAATNKDVEKEVEGKRFREDLFYRLNVIRIHIPPLRERKEDIAQLAAYFLKKYNAEQGKEIKKISGEALNCLMDYDYSGNVRELENAIERAVALEAKDCISVESLPPSIRNRCVKEGSPATPGDKGTVTGPGASTVTIPPEGIDLEEAVSEFEKNIIKEALKKAGGVKGKAAKLLGISFRSIRYKLGKYDE